MVVHRSNTASGTDPTWKAECITMRSLCNGDTNRGLKIECFQEKMNGAHKPLGYCHTTLNNLLALGTGAIRLLSPHDMRVSKLSCMHAFLYVPTNVNPICRREPPAYSFYNVEFHQFTLLLTIFKVARRFIVVSQLTLHVRYNFHLVLIS